MEISGWGRYRIIQGESVAMDSSGPFIARGSGRSYGDSSTASRVFASSRLNRIISFDKSQGHLVCEPGVTIGEILRLTVPAGWAPPVIPGTRFVSVGGALAGDIHGKNHPTEGCFSECVDSFEILLGHGETLSASRSHNADLFHATCGGMGLTGIVRTVSLRLKTLGSSRIRETRKVAKDLEATLVALDLNDRATHRVAWIDGQAGGTRLGRSVAILGELTDAGGKLSYQERRIPSIARYCPEFLLNPVSRTAFNLFYYHLHAFRKSEPKLVPMMDFHFPLDRIKDWNLLYGRRGLIQYQFVVPKNGAQENLAKILNLVQKSRQLPYLTVLKKFGTGNKNLLSFPMDGIGLAMDFKACADVLTLLDRLDQLVLHAGGRVNLTKDVRMSAEVFKASYPSWRQFQAVRGSYRALQKFRSEQSIRLGLE